VQIHGTRAVSKSVHATPIVKKAVRVLILLGNVVNLKCPAIAQTADFNQIQNVLATLITSLVSKLVLVTVLISHTTVIVNVPKVKKVLTVAMNANFKRLNAKTNAHATNSVHTDAHAHHGAFQKNKSVKPFGNMKTNNVPVTVIQLEAKCSICAKADVLVNLLALTHA
jgi:hypothetical protein